MKNKYIRHLVDKLFCPIGPAKQRIIWYIFSFVPLHPFLLSLHPFLFVNFSLSLPLNFISLSSPLCLCHIIHSSSSYPRRHITHFVFFSDLPYETQVFLMLPYQRISGAFATLKKQGRFYRVPFKSLPRVQIKRVHVSSSVPLCRFLFIHSSLSMPLNQLIFFHSSYPILFGLLFSSLPLYPFLPIYSLVIPKLGNLWYSDVQ